MSADTRLVEQGAMERFFGRIFGDDRQNPCVESRAEVEGRAALYGRLHDICLTLQIPEAERRQHGRPIFKIMVESAFCDPRACRDIVDARGIYAVLGEERCRGVKKRSPAEVGLAGASRSPDRSNTPRWQLLCWTRLYIKRSELCFSGPEKDDWLSPVPEYRRLLRRVTVGWLGH